MIGDSFIAADRRRLITFKTRFVENLLVGGSSVFGRNLPCRNRQLWRNEGAIFQFVRELVLTFFYRGRFFGTEIQTFTIKPPRAIRGPNTSVRSVVL